ncbi:DUF6207 family protein [Streptomyces phaeochromogenes]|uniref:DUF6207 family protein n=1 Tax=Streptomyces phaeochromogenes TaxID=1923 RepID=UPI002E28D554|nr:DUF6207 family protein [Streptomyces phaeochromogenes]
MYDESVVAFQNAIARMWGTSTVDDTTRGAGQPGMRLRLYVDLRQILAQASCRSRWWPPARSEAWSATTGGVTDQVWGPRCHIRLRHARSAGEVVAG